MKRKRLMIWSVVVVLAVALAIPAGTVDAAKRRYVSIAAGWVTGAYFPMAGAISRIAWKHLKEDGIKVTAESSGASVANAKLIGAGEPALPGISIGHNRRIAFGLTLSTAPSMIAARRIAGVNGPLR